jgi:septal ring factor EnvC (AmiA/AmiB activator)
VINSLAAAGGGESVAESAIDIVEQNVLKIFADEVQRLEDIKVKWCEESISRASRSSIAASEYYAGNPAMWNDLSSRERSFHNESIRRTAEVALVAEAEKLEEEMHLRGKEIERLAASFIASTAQKASAKKAAEDTAAELLRNLRKQIAQAREKVAKARAFVNSTHNRWTDMFQTQTKKQAIDSLLQAETDLMNLQTRYRPLNREAAMTEYPILRRNYDEEACFEFEQNEKKRRLQWAQRTPVEKELYLAHWQSKDYKVVCD